MLLRKGADPNVRLWRSATEGWPAFAAYLNLTFEMPSDTDREALYLRVLGDFLSAGATLDMSYTTFMNDSIQQPLGNRVTIASTSVGFFGRLNNMRNAELRACNFRLLTEVVYMLCSIVDESKATWFKSLIMTAAERAFPAEIYERVPTVQCTKKRGLMDQPELGSQVEDVLKPKRRNLGYRETAEV
jgi:hypothetical protein